MKNLYLHHPERAKTARPQNAASRGQAPTSRDPLLGLQTRFGNQALQKFLPGGPQSQGSPSTPGSSPHGVAPASQTASSGPWSPDRQLTSDTGRLRRNLDPMAFIEEQLKRRFRDPKDPRLSIRVKDLQEAFHRLSPSQARRLLDQLEGSPRGWLAPHFQRLATPSRTKLLAILRSKLPPDIEGDVLGELRMGPKTFPLIAAMEVIPSTFEPRAFAGFLDVSTARDVALRRPTIAAVVQDRHLRYRVFDTGLPIRRRPPYPTIVPKEQTGYRVVEWIHDVGEEMASLKTREARIERARGLLNKYEHTYRNKLLPPQGPSDQRAEFQEIQEAFTQLLKEALPFVQHRIRSMEEINLGGSLMTTADPDSINVDIFAGMGGHGLTGLLDSFSAHPLYPGARTRVSIPQQFRDLPEGTRPYIRLAPGATTEPLFSLGVLVHEEAHAAHYQRTVELIHQWKAEGAPGTFKQWAKTTFENGDLRADAILANESIERKPGEAAYNSEVLAEVAGFTGVFHALGQHEDWALDRLGQMGNMWLHSDPEIQELSLRQMHHYYQRMLDQTSRDTFDNYVWEKRRQAEEADPDTLDHARQEFYSRLEEFGAVVLKGQVGGRP